MLRIVTYNVHKCQGLDRRVRPARIASVLRELDADVIALQEVVCHAGADRAEMDQAKFIAGELGYEYCLGENRKHRGAAYGNVVLSRLPWGCVENHDITWRGRERRGALRVDVQLDDGAGGQLPLHLFNVHLGTAFIERRHQARALVGEKILRRPDLGGVRVVLGDFNEFPRGLATRLLSEELRAADIRTHLKSARTYPGVLPVAHLDHIYYDPPLELTRLTLHKTPTALVASDHLPLVADFELHAP